MGVDGVWKIEMKGVHGWEQLGALFLQDGRYLAASADYYFSGSYKVAGGAFAADLQVSRYGKVRSIFRSKKKHMRHLIDAKIKEPGKIVGTVYPAASKKIEIKIRLTRLGDID